MSGKERPRREDFVEGEGNRVLFSLGYEAWRRRSTEEIRSSLRARAGTRPLTCGVPDGGEKVGDVVGVV